MAPATELARILEKILERKLARIPEMEPTKALEIAQSGQWVLSFQPLASFAVADPLTWLGIVLPEVLAARASPEEELLSAAEGQE